MRQRSVVILGIAVVIVGVAANTCGQDPTDKTTRQNATMTKQTKFYCNTNALNPTERAHHKQLTEKLIATRKETVETDKGYEFSIQPVRHFRGRACRMGRRREQVLPLLRFSH
jgi:hypothetical protein